MDVRMKNNNNKAAASFSFPKMRPTTTPPLVVDGKKVLYHRSFSQGQGHARRIFPFSIESSLLLVCLTASLLILPLILPPLPPPPFMLLLLPIGILAVLMILAFMPSSDVRHITTTATYTYM
ncbi:unnamed protein product [Camellia sinensis]